MDYIKEALFPKPIHRIYMSQILSFSYTIWLVFSRIFASKRISVLLIIVLKVKHPWKGIRTLELEPQGSRFWLITQSLPRTLQQKLDSKSTLPHIIPSPERPGLPCWGFWVLFVWIRDPGGSVQLCLFANRRQFPTRKAIWIRTACLAAAQRFSLKPAGSRWINRTQRYRLNPCKLLTLG